MLKGGQNRSSRRTWIPDDFVETINQSWDYRSPVFLQKKKKGLMVPPTIGQIFLYLQSDTSSHIHKVKGDQELSGEKGRSGDRQLPQKY